MPHNRISLHNIYVNEYNSLLLQILLLICLPMCLAQFSIQGPSDGNRVAQGLKYSEEKGIEYTDQKASLGAGDFSIQGASDGNTQFTIQGATDGHSNFQIQGPQDGGAAQFHIQGGPVAGANAQFNIQGATDGHSQSIIQQPYDANQQSNRALQYNDPSGLRVNWKSYQHRGRQQPQQQYQEEQQYVKPVPQRVIPQRAARQRVRQQQPLQEPQLQPQTQQAHVQPPNYTPYENAPPSIKQLLQYQAQIPYINIIPEHLRFDTEAAQRAQAEQLKAHYQNLKAEPPQYTQYRASKHRPQSREKREAQEPDLSQYRRIAQPKAEALPQYSTNVPSSIQQLLKFQAQIPYNIIANQITYRLEKPYVPQPVKSPQQYQQQSEPQQPIYPAPQAEYQPQQPTYQAPQSDYQPQQPDYQSQQLNYQSQQAAYQPQLAAYRQQQAAPQAQQPSYQLPQAPQSPLQQYRTKAAFPRGQSPYPQGQRFQGQGIRPVTESQY
ncbi:transcription factor SPT20 homolog [Prorops nasuta]|uniref:transcription factor SPT20 homolog n=1 Tax=Prorops nasuta TaxID=863751 RepID=UPI0034CEF958